MNMQHDIICKTKDDLDFRRYIKKIEKKNRSLGGSCVFHDNDDNNDDYGNQYLLNA